MNAFVVKKDVRKLSVEHVVRSVFYARLVAAPYNYRNCGELLREGMVKNQISFGFCSSIRRNAKRQPPRGASPGVNTVFDCLAQLPMMIPRIDRPL